MAGPQVRGSVDWLPHLHKSWNNLIVGATRKDKKRLRSDSMCAEDPFSDLSRYCSSVKCVLFAGNQRLCSMLQVGEEVPPVTILPIYSQLPSDLQAGSPLYQLDSVTEAVIDCEQQVSKAKIFESSDKRKIIVASG